MKKLFIALSLLTTTTSFACVHISPGEGGGGGRYTVDKWGASHVGQREKKEEVLKRRLSKGDMEKIIK